MAPKSKPLDDIAARIAALQSDIDAFLDAKAEELKVEAPNVPVAVLRNIITNRSHGCQCRAYLNILENE